jgi:hypothetical protein
MRDAMWPGIGELTLQDTELLAEQEDLDVFLVI